MSVFKTFHLYCDTDGCQAEFDYSAPSVREIRKLARRGGWKTTAIYDFCPEHVNTPEPRRLSIYETL